jgi:hypothetical protein
MLAYQSDITGSVVALINGSFIQYSLQELLVGSNLNNLTLAFIKSLSCYLNSSLHPQAPGCNFLLPNLLPAVSSG